MKINSLGEDIIKSNLNNDVLLNTNKLTPNEEIGFMFEGEISDSLTMLGIEHDIFPHLSRKLFKQNRNVDGEQNKGVDFRIIVNGFTVMIESKDYQHMYGFYLHNITDRFKGEGNRADYNLCVVADKYKSGFYKFRDILYEQYGIILLDIKELPLFIRWLKSIRRGINYIINNSILSLVYSVFRIILRKPKKYLKQFLIFPNYSSRFLDLVENSMKNKSHLGEIEMKYKLTKEVKL